MQNTDQNKKNKCFFKFLKRTTYLILLFLLMSSVDRQVYGSEFFKKSNDMIMINTKAMVLDRNGKRQVITDIYDSIMTPVFIVSTGRSGQSPIYQVPKKDVVSMELDEIHTNMSGWDYAAVKITLADNKIIEGYIKTSHLGLHGYRNFQGTSEFGSFLISWKRIKRVDFEGNWIEIPAHKTSE